MGITILVLLMVCVLGVAVWLFMQIGRAGSSADALDNRARIAITIPIVAIIVLSALYASILSPFVIVACSIPISLMWTPQLVETALRPLWTAFDGGSESVEPTPFYFRAEAHRKKGDYAEAIYEIHHQLQLFPEDFDGLMLLATVQADDLKDLESAQATLGKILSKTDRIDREQILVLNRMADLHFKAGDLTSTRSVLQQIPARWPNTEAAKFAHQRLSHLPDDETMVKQRETQTVKMREFEQNIGLKLTSTEAASPYEHPSEAASRLVRQLALHPNDWEARERLAALYALQFQRPDLASAEYELLISNSSQPVKSVVRWLNQLADLHLARPDGVADAKATLQRIADRFPNTPAGDAAVSRIARMGIETKARREAKTIRLGVYEQNIGLKPKA